MDVWKEYGMGFPPREVIQQGLNVVFYQQFEQIKSLYDLASEHFQFDFYEDSFIKTDKQKGMVCLLLYCHGIQQLLKDRIGDPQFTLGFSQGEFVAITASGGMEILEMMDLVDRLEDIIDKNQKKLEGKMYRVVGLRHDRLQEICMEEDPTGKEVSIGIRISEEQNVITGVSPKVDMVCKRAKEEKARFIIGVGDHVFHCPLCDEVQDVARMEFLSHKFQDSDVGIYSCFSGQAEKDAKKIQNNISNQIANPVQWKNICDDISRTGVKRIIEIGPGTTVSGNMRLNNPMLQYDWINSPADLDAVVKKLKA